MSEQELSSNPGSQDEPPVDGGSDYPRERKGVRRGPVLAVVVAALLIAGLADRAGGEKTSTGGTSVSPVPVAASASALSTSWFCAGAMDAGSSPGLGHIVIANSGPKAVPAHVSVVSSNGRTRDVDLTVPADGAASVPETVGGGAPWVGAIVDVDAGAVAVAQDVANRLGRSLSPCATSGSDAWYFPAGSTLINSDTAITLLNPYPSDSIVDLSFSTDQGVESPEDYQGVDVPARGLVTVDLRDRLRRRMKIATSVTVRTGSVVAWETAWTEPPARGAALIGTKAAQSPNADPASPHPGLTVALGAPSTGTRWVWAEGRSGNGIDERYDVYNPGNQTADLKLALDLQQGTAEPIDLSVGPSQVVQVVSTDQVRIPAGVAHSVVLTSVNGVPVVAERTVAAGGAATSSPRQSGAKSKSAAKSPPAALVAAGGESGLGAMFGMRLASSTWLVPATASRSAWDGYLSIYNPQARAVQIEVRALTRDKEQLIGPAGGYVVGPSSRLAIPLTAAAAYANPLLVTSTSDTYVEYGTPGASGTGMAFASGVPVATGSGPGPG